ncbi:MAG: glycosyltransferase family 2 protein [Gemmatimonadota bacterium]
MDPAMILLVVSAGVVLYAYAGYPVLLWLATAFGRRRGEPPAKISDDEWPMISISLPVYNEAAQVRETIESLLALDYPADRLQIVVISDASDDGTDEIVAEYADRGVDLVRQPERRGKTAAENAGRRHLRGEIVVNTDASIRIRPDALKPLIARFADPTVGVASGRDVSVTRVHRESNVGESGYVGYEMWVRDLETRLAGIVGASGCFYAIRAHLHQEMLPEALSRDFAAAMVAREHGFRAVSVNEAVCYVPRARSLRHEYRRKVRTITRGLETLFFKRHLLNPFHYGAFAWMLFSHKLCRWLAPWFAMAAVAALAVLAASEPWALAAVGGVLLGFSLAAAGWLWPDHRKPPRLLALPAFMLVGNAAAIQGMMNALRGELNPVWEPTRREAVPASLAKAE